MQLAIPIFERLDMFLWSIKVQYFGPLLNKLDVKNLILWSCIIFDLPIRWNYANWYAVL